MNWQLPFQSGRQPVLARNIVSTSQPLASQAGAAVFARGGNAIDAAIAAAITLTVVEPTMNGIGGDGFSIIWDGKKLHGLNASGRAPAAWSPERGSLLDLAETHGLSPEFSCRGGSCGVPGCGGGRWWACGSPGRWGALHHGVALRLVRPRLRCFPSDWALGLFDKTTASD